MQHAAFEETVTNGKLHLFSLYADFEASVRARRVVGTITQLTGQHWQCSSEMWKLDSLATSQPIKKMITDDAANADVLVIAASSLEKCAFDLVHWLDFLANRKPNRSLSGLLVGLLGNEENKSQELSGTVKRLINCAQKTNRDFVWQWMGQDAPADCDWLTEGVERLLTRKQFPREQINLQETAVGID
jgi:hypothetical protein